MNESQTLGDLNLFTPLLQLVERHGNMDEKRLRSEIGALIGRCIALEIILFDRCIYIFLHAMIVK